MEKHSKKSSERVIWGFVLLFAAVALLINKMGVFKGVSIWGVLFTLAFAAMLLDGIRKKSVGGILIPAAFLIIIYDKPLHLEAITPWPILGAAILATAGIHMLFPRLSRHNQIMRNSEGGVTRDQTIVKYENHFGSSVKYLNGDITYVDIDSAFGSFELYLNEANLVNGSATVHIDSSFGEVKLYVPSNWKVQINVINSVASIDQFGRGSDAGLPEILLTGEVSFGHLVIQYI